MNRLRQPRAHEPLVNAAAEAGLMVKHSIELQGDYATAVKVITAHGQAMGTRPDKTSDSIHLSYYRHPHQYDVHAYDHDSELTQILKADLDDPPGADRQAA